MRRKARVEVEILRTRIKGRQSFFGFVLSTSIPRFKFLHNCSIFPILVLIFEMLVLNEKERHIELF